MRLRCASRLMGVADRGRSDGYAMSQSAAVKTTDTSMADAKTAELALSVSGMNCASCVSHVSNAIRGVGGVASCDVNLARGRATLRFDPAATSPKVIAAAVTAAGYPAEPEDADDGANVEHQRSIRQSAEASAWFRRAVVGVALWLPFELLHWTVLLIGGHHPVPAHRDWMALATLAAATVAIAYVGGKFYRSALNALRRGTTNMDVLIAMGASVAYLYSVVFMAGGLFGWWTPPTAGQLFFMEGTGLLALISLGHWLEARARQSAGSAIRELLDLTPATAMRLRTTGGNAKNANNTNQSTDFDPVAVADLAIGDVILVRPGDRVASDGEVVSGVSAIDESMLTGESLPVTRSVGDAVIGGTVNRDGAIQVRVNRVGSETALAQIVKLVESAQASRPPVQKLADRISAIFVPTVLGLALLTGIGWFIHGHLTHLPQGLMWGNIANAVCSVLIIACPCALGLAVPAALMVGTGRGARRGILIRDIDALQQAQRIDTVVLDKTGTITLGRPQVTIVQPAEGADLTDLLTLVASSEQFSEHPIAKAIVTYAKSNGAVIQEPESFTNQPGRGVAATIGGREILVGSESLLIEHGYQSSANEKPTGSALDAATLVLIGERTSDTVRLIGRIGLSDTIRPDSANAIAAMKALGLTTVLLTGDRQQVAAQVAAEVGIETVHASVLPDAKADVIKQLQQAGKIVAMVGDGVNDAPALAQANLGIAVGSGSDVAKETGDIVLVSGSLAGVVEAVKLSAATMRVIHQNLFFAFFYNVLAIPLAAMGLLNPLIAAAAMALSDVTVLGNALRLRRMKLRR